MDLKSALRLKDDVCLALVGAGGKSTALFQLGECFEPACVLTTTTHLAVEQAERARHHVILRHREDWRAIEEIALDGTLLITGPPEGERLSGLDEAALERLWAFCRRRALPLLIEADGARRRALKAPATHEPVVPPFAEEVVVVAGLTALGKPLSEAWVHRPEHFAALCDLAMGDIITPAALAQVLVHPQGGLKGVPPRARRTVLLNQAEDALTQAQAARMTPALLQRFSGVVLASLQRGQVWARFEKMAGVVLAAGAGKRIGQPKVLLPWRRKPLVWHVVRAALLGGLTPVVVVAGQHHQAVRATLAGQPVQVVVNPAWEQGQSTSVKAGLGALPQDIGAAVFLLADQPLLSPLLVRQLVEEHARSGAPIVAPLVGGRRGNPVLFDRTTFPAFSALKGDQGARPLFARFPVRWLTWLDEMAMLDVDTPEDYRRLPD